MIDLLVLDLDNTLYPRESGLFAAVDERITLYLRETLAIDGAEADALRRRYRDDYHLTLIGLMRHFGVDAGHYLEFVHDLPIEEFISPDGELGSILDALGVPAVVLTNGSKPYAARVLRALGIDGRIAGVVGIEEAGYVPKPFPDGYLLAMGITGARAAGTLFVDDMEANLAGARILGMATGLVHPTKGARPNRWDYSAPDVVTLLREVRRRR